MSRDGNGNVEKPLVFKGFFARLIGINGRHSTVPPGAWGGEGGGASPPQQLSLINQANGIRGLEDWRIRGGLGGPAEFSTRFEA